MWDRLFQSLELGNFQPDPALQKWIDEMTEGMNSRDAENIKDITDPVIRGVLVSLGMAEPLPEEPKKATQERPGEPEIIPHGKGAREAEAPTEESAEAPRRLTADEIRSLPKPRWAAELEEALDRVGDHDPLAGGSHYRKGWSN